MNSYIVDCLEPQPGSFTSTLRADAHPHEHASSGWGGAPLSIQVPGGRAVPDAPVLAGAGRLVVDVGIVGVSEPGSSRDPRDELIDRLRAENQRLLAENEDLTGRLALWGSRTRPPVLTWAFRRLARIR